MAASYETGQFANRGFSAVDANGFLTKLSSWLGRTYAQNGAGWTLIDNQSTYRTATFTVPDHTNDRMYSVGHGLVTGQEITVGSSTTLPTGLTANMLLFVIWIDADNIKVATTLLNALAGTPIDITSAGTGTHTFYTCPYMVYCNVAAPTVNQVAKFIKIQYAPVNTALGYSNAIQIVSCLWWDVTNHIPRGIWNKYNMVTSGAAVTDTYWFVGNTSFIHLVSYAVSTYVQVSIGDWTSPSTLIVEGADLGVLASGITAGGGVVTSLGSGQAAYFTVGNYYFIYDMNGHSWVDYVKVTARDLGLDTITLQNVAYSFPTGAVIGAYPHRYYSMSNGSLTSGTFGNVDNFSYSKSTIPYISSTSGTTSNVFHAQTGSIRISSRLNFYPTALAGGDPDDENLYYVQRPSVSEYERGDAVIDTTGLRLLGYIPTTGGLYLTSSSNLTLAVTKRSISGLDYMYFLVSTSIMAIGGDAGTYVLIQAARN